MHLQAPNLDDRHFQDLVDEAKRSIPRYCPTWTDHNVSDPGVTLIELFAWMTEQYLFRLNQVPDKNFITFLDLIGVRLEPPRPARGDVTFELTAPPTARRRTIIPAWTEVATERTETDEAVVFTTDEEAEVVPATLRHVFTTTDASQFVDHGREIADSLPFNIWSGPPKPGDSVYFGFAENLSAHKLVLRMTCDQVALGIVGTLPPWRWEVWRGNEAGWEPLSVASDSTAGLYRKGEIAFYLPYRCAPNRINRVDGETWLRCSPTDQLKPGMTAYASSPRLRRAEADTLGISVPVTHAVAVWGEVVGISNGESAQSFRVQHQNVLSLEGPDEVVEVENAVGAWESWQRVADFGDSGPQDRHFVFDPSSGQVEFGPAIRQTNGTEPQFGAIPPRGRRIRLRRYRIGGGVRGNVAEGLVRVLKTTIPYVRGVTNRFPLTGGEEAQTLEDAKFRGPKSLRTRHRAVTVDDYEYLSQGVEGVGRVRCLQPRHDDPSTPAPGTVTLLVIPSLPKLDGAELDRHVTLHESLPGLALPERRAAVDELQTQMTLAPATRERLRAFLDSRRLLTTRLDIREPEYVWVTVTARVKAVPKADPERVRRDVRTALYRFLHPLYGGSEGQGWPFGQPLTVDKVYTLIRSVRGVEYASELRLFPINMQDLVLRASQEIIQIPANGVIASYYHAVLRDE
jgi:predicted phage baseplate assembly protein